MSGQDLTRDDVVPVSFGIGEARHGWITLTVRAGDQVDRIACSDVYDPFQELVDWAGQVALGMQACMEIDEEGVHTQMWLSRSPGSHLARLQVFEPGSYGQPDPMTIDAAVDAVQVAHAFHEAFSAYVKAYDPRHWDINADEGKPAKDILGAIDLRALKAYLGSYGLFPGGEHFVEARGAYDAELGELALPDLTLPDPSGARAAEPVADDAGQVEALYGKLFHHHHTAFDPPAALRCIAEALSEASAGPAGKPRPALGTDSPEVRSLDAEAIRELVGGTPESAKAVIARHLAKARGGA